MCMYDVVIGVKYDEIFKDLDMLDMVDLICCFVMFFYIDGEEYVFMDKEDYIFYYLNKDSIENEVLFINEDIDGIQVVIVSEVLVVLDLFMSVEFEVVEIDFFIKGVLVILCIKLVIFLIGLVVQVFEYISIGEWIKVNIEECKF